MGPEGGSVECGPPSAAIRLEIPPGAVEQPVEITVEARAPIDVSSIGPAFSVGPTDLVFAQPVRVQMSVGGALQQQSSWVALAAQRPGRWRTLGHAQIDDAAGMLAGRTWAAGTFSARIEPDIDMLDYLIPHNLCGADKSRSQFRGGRGIIPASPHETQGANGEVFFYLAKNDGNHTEIRGFEEMSVDEQAIYILSDYTWGVGENRELVCKGTTLAEGHLGRGQCMDNPSACGPDNDYAWTRYHYAADKSNGVEWLPRYIRVPQKEAPPCNNGARCMHEHEADINYVGVTMARLWSWLDPNTALPRCEAECTNADSAPDAPPQQRWIQVTRYGPRHTPCAQLPEGKVREHCEGMAATAGNLPVMVESFVAEGFGKGERYWYALGEGWVAYDRGDGQIEYQGDGAWQSRPEWYLPDFDCRAGATRPGAEAGQQLCAMMGEAQPEPGSDPNPTPEPLCIDLPGNLCEVPYPVWTCVGDTLAQRTIDETCEQDCCETCEPSEPDCMPSACVGAPTGSDDGCRSNADLGCDPDAAVPGISEALPGALHPDGLALAWPFAEAVEVRLLQGYGRWSWPLHRGVVRTTASNDEYALDMQPVVQGDPTGTAVLAAADGIVRHIENPTDESLSEAAEGDWPSFTGLGRRVILAHCDASDPCPGEGDANVRHYSLYSHLDDVSIEVGDELKSGDPLGTLGATGNASGVPHLHFALYRRDPVDCESCSTATLAGADTVSVVAGQAVVPEPMGTDTCLRAGGIYGGVESGDCAQARIVALDVPDGCCDDVEIWPGCEATATHQQEYGQCGLDHDFSSVTAEMNCNNQTVPLTVAADGTFCLPTDQSLGCTSATVEYTLPTPSGGTSRFGTYTYWNTEAHTWNNLEMSLGHESIYSCCH